MISLDLWSGYEPLFLLMNGQIPLVVHEDLPRNETNDSVAEDWTTWTLCVRM